MTTTTTILDAPSPQGSPRKSGVEAKFNECFAKLDFFGKDEKLVSEDVTKMGVSGNDESEGIYHEYAEVPDFRGPKNSIDGVIHQGKLRGIVIGYDRHEGMDQQGRMNLNQVGLGLWIASEGQFGGYLANRLQVPLARAKGVSIKDRLKAEGDQMLKNIPLGSRVEVDYLRVDYTTRGNKATYRQLIGNPTIISNTADHVKVEKNQKAAEKAAASGK